MKSSITTIGVVAPGRTLTREIAEKVECIAQDLYGAALELRFHDQCFLSAGHFAGSDAARSSAFKETANDPEIDAVWFARGGYGACRLEDHAFSDLNKTAKNKTYIGYSDAGAILARLYGMAFPSIAHGPMPADILRSGGATAIERALHYIVDRNADTIDPALPIDTPAVAFNMTMLAHLAGTSWLPDLSGHILLLEDVAEYHYRLDRAMFTIVNTKAIENVAGIMLGRCTDIPQNDITFGANEETIVRDWCARSGIAYLGRADIGHDTDNKIIPFGVQTHHADKLA